MIQSKLFLLKKDRFLLFINKYLLHLTHNLKLNSDVNNQQLRI